MGSTKIVNCIGRGQKSQRGNCLSPSNHTCGCPIIVFQNAVLWGASCAESHCILCQACSQSLIVYTSLCDYGCIAHVESQQVAANQAW